MSVVLVVLKEKVHFWEAFKSQPSFLGTAGTARRRRDGKDGYQA